MEKIEDLVDIQAEAGVVASIIQKPDLLLSCGHLKPHHFSDNANSALYDAISSLYDDGVERIDAFNLVSCINRNEKIKRVIDKEFPDHSLDSVVENSSLIARMDENDFGLLVKRVLDLSLHRETYKKLEGLRRLCLDPNIASEDLTKTIADAIDNTVMDYIIYKEPVLLGDICDELWEKTKSKRRSDGDYGYPSVIPQFRDYFVYEPGELVLYSAKPKRGKSILLMNEAVNLAKNYQRKVLYIDSELTTEQFNLRIMSHLSKIPVKLLKTGDFSTLPIEKKQTAEKDIIAALREIKKMQIRHEYRPGFDKDWLIATCKKLKKEGRIDVLIFDYFKGAATKGEDASTVYLGLSRAADIVKNFIAGELGLISIAACQSNRNDEVADSIGLERSCSTLVFMDHKTPNRIMQDTTNCGNFTFRVSANRNGQNMDSDDWIDAKFNGNLCTFEKAEQHTSDSVLE